MATAVKAKKEPRAWVWIDGKKTLLVYPEPKKLSKFGEWMRDHPEGIGEILDMRAVMR